MRDWRDIPAFPTDAFKTGIVTSFPFEQAVMAQLTSGTTANQRGQIFRDAIGRELVLTANRVMTAAWLFPDFAQGQRCRILILAPSPEMAPSMGMAIAMEETRKHFGTADSRHYDLINVPTVIGVQTDNLGYTNADGSFQIVGRARQENGAVSELPSERVVGPMGDKRIFRFLESYVNFSIRFKMGLLDKIRRSAPAVGAKPTTPMTPPVCPCDEISEEMLSETGRQETKAASSGPQ